MTQKLIRPLAAGLAVVFAGGLSLGAVAATPATPAQPVPQVAPATDSAQTPRHGHADRKGMSAKRHAARDGLFIAGLGPIPKSQLESLKLSADQQKEVEAIRAAQRDMHQNMRAAHEARAALLKQQLNDGRLDPAALASASEKAREGMREPGQALQKRSLAFWDGLTDAQRQNMTDYVKAREEKKAEHRKNRERGPKPADRAATPPAAN